MAAREAVVKQVEKTLPASDRMTPAEQKYFENGGEDSPETLQDQTVEQAVPEPVAEQPVEQQAEGAEAAQGKGKAPQGFVPHGALHEERELRKAAEARAKLLEERTNIILEKFGQPTQAPAPVVQPIAADEIPSLETDPLGHILGQMKAQAKEQEELKKNLSERAQQDQQTFAVQRLTGTAVSMEQEFARATPDYNEAASFLREGRRQEYTAMGYNPQQVEQAIQQEALGIANMALQRGQNPAEVIYTLAKTRGFAKAPPAPPAVQENGLPIPQENAQSAERLATVAKGQQQNQSLGNIRGSAPAPLTAQKLLEMSPDEFAKVLNTPEGRNLMGA